MGGLGLFKGQNITSRSRLIDICVFIVNGMRKRIDDEQSGRKFENRYGKRGDKTDSEH